MRAHGKEAYFLIAPVLYHVKHPKQARRAEDGLVVLDFNDPENYPQLYERKVRGNTSHLTESGSRMYSKYLARSLKQLERRRRK